MNSARKKNDPQVFQTEVHREITKEQTKELIPSGEFSFTRACYGNLSSPRSDKDQLLRKSIVRTNEMDTSLTDR